jgi:hypothetical protein
MGLKEIIARNEEWRKAGTLPGALGTSTKVELRGAKAVPARVPLNLVPCRFLGDRLPGGCGSRLRRCNHFGDVTTQFAPCPDANRCCQTCTPPPEEGAP